MAELVHFVPPEGDGDSDTALCGCPLKVKAHPTKVVAGPPHTFREKLVTCQACLELMNGVVPTLAFVKSLFGTPPTQCCDCEKEANHAGDPTYLREEKKLIALCRPCVDERERKWHREHSN